MQCRKSYIRRAGKTGGNRVEMTKGADGGRQLYNLLNF